jgi:hypothetical protein
MIETNDSVIELERIKAKRAIVFNEKSLCMVGEKHMKQIGASVRMNLEFNLEENGLSKWRKS